jgi:hypothetical protein
MASVGEFNPRKLARKFVQAATMQLVTAALAALEAGLQRRIRQLDAFNSGCS